jgi:hypothetical protein
MFRYLLALALILMIQAIHGFAPPQAQTKTQSRAAAAATFRSANFVSAAAPTRAIATPFVILRMAAAEDEEKSLESKISADGTFYDDEVSLLLYNSPLRIPCPRSPFD